jgi:RHS repeat-associated protein
MAICLFIISALAGNATNAAAASCYPNGDVSGAANIGFQYVAQGCTSQGKTIYAQYDLRCKDGIVQAFNEVMGGTPRTPDEMQTWITGYQNYQISNDFPPYFATNYIHGLKQFRSDTGSAFVLVQASFYTIPGSHLNGKTISSTDYSSWPTYNAINFGRFDYPDNPNSSPCCLEMPPPSAPASFKPSMNETVSIFASATSNYPINWTLTLNGATTSGSGSPSYTWNGKDANGFPVSPGVYNAAINATSASCTPVDASVPVTVVEPPRSCDKKVPIGSSADVATGNLSFSQEVFSVKGVAAPLGLTLFYNSLDTTQGSLGQSWKHNYEISLQNADSSGKVLVEGGTRHVYTWNGSAYTAETGDTSALVKNGSTYDLSFIDGRKYHFLADGKLDTVTDKDNNVLTFTYNGSDLTAVSDGGRSIILGYDPVVAHRLTSVSDPNGNAFSFVYLGSMLQKVVNPVTDAGVAAGFWQFTYNSDNLLQAKTDPASNTIQYGYSSKRVNSSTDPNNQTRGITYPSTTGNVRTTTFTDKNGSQWQYTYDIQSGFLKYKNPLNGPATSYYYNSDTTLRARTEPFNNNFLTTFFTYDNHGNLLTQTDPVDISTYINPTIEPQTVDIASLATRTPPIKTALRYTYNATNFDQVASVTDERFTPFRTTSYAYTTENGLKVTTVTDPEGKQTIARYNANGTLAEAQDGNGKKTTYSYYPNTTDNQTAGIVGLLQSVTTPDGVVTSYTIYDKNGNPLEIKVKDTNQREVRTVKTFDALNRLRTVTRYAQGLPNNVTSYKYDANNNRSSVIDPELHETKYQYNYQGQVTKVTDARSKDTTYQYDANGCPSCSGVDKLTAIADARQKTTSYQYDTLGRLERETDPLGKVIRYTYYDNNLLKDKIDTTTPAAEVILITHSYDTSGRLTKKHYADGTETTFSYYPDGTLQTATNPNISYNYTYYANGWLKSVSDSNSRTINYDLYDNNGQIKTVTYFPTTADQRVIQYHYDTANRLDSITSPAGVFSIGYDSLSRRQTITYPNQIIATSGYDDLNRLTSLVHQPQGGSVIATYGYTHDQAGNRKTKTGTLTEAYTYDEIYRLTQADTARGSEKYSYDDVGNRLTGPGPKDTGYSYNDGNQIMAGRTLTYLYDNQGNQTQRFINNAPDKSWILTWDYENRLTKIEKNKGASEKRTTSFKYDPLGRRIEKKHVTTKDVTIEGVTTTITKSTTTTYVYDGDNVILEIFDDGTTPIKTFYTHGQGVDEPLALERSGSFYFYHADGLGSITAITDATKYVIQRYTYDSFGVPKANTAFRNPYQFTGREWDMETNLYFYRARYYDPFVGKFILKDPISFEGGDINLYGYVQQNPINFTDSTGLATDQGGRGPLTSQDPDVQRAVDMARRNLEEAKKYLKKVITDLEAELKSLKDLCDRKDLMRRLDHLRGALKVLDRYFKTPIIIINPNIPTPYNPQNSDT